MENNRHALVNMKSGLVTNIIIWDGAQWIPPENYYVIKTNEGQIGDYWDQNNNVFYTFRGKRRFVCPKGKCGEQDLTEEETTRIKPYLDKVFQKVRQQILDATLAIEKKEQ